MYEPVTALKKYINILWQLHPPISDQSFSLYICMYRTFSSRCRMQKGLPALRSTAKRFIVNILWAALSVSGPCHCSCRYRGGCSGAHDGLVLRSGGIGSGGHDLTRLLQLLHDIKDSNRITSVSSMMMHSGRQHIHTFRKYSMAFASPTRTGTY